MTKTEFLETMRSERAQWRSLLAELGETRMLTPGVAGDWSMKDVVAHVTAYERGLVEWLEAASRGESLTFADLDHPDVDHRNALIFAQNRGRSLHEVLEDADRIFQQLVELVDAVPEEDLTDPDRTEWFVKPRWKTSRPLWECIADDACRHYPQHLPGTRAWLGEQVTCAREDGGD